MHQISSMDVSTSEVKNPKSTMDAAIFKRQSEFKYSQQIPDLHNEMVAKLSREIAPCRKMMDDWDNLLKLFSNDAPLSNVQIDNISSIGGLVGLLMQEHYISYEDYEPFAKKLEKIFPRMARLVREYSKDILEQIRLEKGRTLSNKEKKKTNPSQRIQNLENEMVVKLSNYLDPQLKQEWAEFDCRLKGYLSPVCRGSLSNINQAFAALKDKEVIRTGDYSILKDMVKPIHAKMSKIIDECTCKIQAEMDSLTLHVR